MNTHPAGIAGTHTQGGAFPATRPPRPGVCTERTNKEAQKMKCIVLDSRTIGQAFAEKADGKTTAEILRDLGQEEE